MKYISFMSEHRLMCVLFMSVLYGVLDTCGVYIVLLFVCDVVKKKTLPLSPKR